MTETEVFYPDTVAAWRKWLKKNHQSSHSVWLVFYKKSAGKPTITWSEAVDVALCYGWIDSKKVKADDETSHQFFSRRKANSTWSKINKLKVEALIAGGHMTDAGLKSIETARQNGSWNLLDEVEELIIPDDLEKAFSTKPAAREFFLNLSRSVKKMMLHWLVMAKRPETRQKRISEIVDQGEKNLKPLHMR
jgi:uncharacterized protein YdeI (YjbR/CyaY-like superfamily)